MQTKAIYSKYTPFVTSYKTDEVHPVPPAPAAARREKHNDRTDCSRKTTKTRK